MRKIGSFFSHQNDNYIGKPLGTNWWKIPKSLLSASAYFAIYNGIIVE